MGCQLKGFNHPSPSEPPASPRRCWSLTLWLTFFNAVSAFFLMSLIAALLYGGLAAQLKKQNHIFLHDEVNTIKNLLSTQGHVAPVIKELGHGQSGVEYVKHYIRLMDRKGRLILETPGMGKLIPSHLFPTPVSSSRTSEDRTWRTSNGALILMTAARVEMQNSSGQHGVVQAALDITNVDEILVDYRQKIYLLLSLGFVLCIAVSFLIASRGTRPLREMAEMIRGITVANLEERISGHGWPLELSGLADAMNLMLHRLDDSFARLYKSATNLSHKMRTPLTILRGEAEVALSRNRSNEELQDVIASSLEEVGRLSRLGESILFLANAEMGKFKMEQSLLDCREEADQVIDYYWPSAEEKGITLNCQGDASLRVDGVLFRKLVAALISNALTYNAPGGTVSLTLKQANELSGEISVTDSGCGIPDSEMVKIFDRFYRIYATRHMDPHGTGLGLPIAKAIMDLHDGSIAVQSVPGEGTTITLRFPAPFEAPAF
jgi:two-component system heavy metal sensor histidine kinase CusS